ncbi:ComEA family DNA-binding protein [Bacillus sp. Marseille-Q3570]|uniref:ComEA family DNA-binding protein n=1 Tax=Bacillus sp. Marseille-Q3570 TaxID=2963522 RepID=UPI0021B72BBA|nr:ComEA family DNA-binding protein [Bacillus sp. Marseille-Q3570]
MNWDSFSKRERILILLIILLVGGFFWMYQGVTTGPDVSGIPSTLGEDEEEGALPSQVNNQKTEARVENRLIVDVKGAVRSPGIFEMKSGQRVNDAVQLAGGFNEDADQNSINLAQILVDEMVIYVAAIGETAPPVASAEKEDGKIDINHAEASALETIPGIGPSKAGAIISYREENGGFASIDDLMNVPGIGQKTFEQLKEYITASK